MDNEQRAVSEQWGEGAQGAVNDQGDKICDMDVDYIPNTQEAFSIACDYLDNDNGVGEYIFDFNKTTHHVTQSMKRKYSEEINRQNKMIRLSNTS